MALPMEFWGVEVKAGQPLKVDTGGKLLHLSQASLGESKSGKGSGFVPLHVKFGDKKLVLGTLSPETIPQLSFDLVFEKEFELSHNWKNGSVYFCGYTSIVQDDEEFSDDESDGEEEAKLPVSASENGLVKSKPEAAAAKPNQQPKPKVSIVEPIKTDEDASDEDDDEDDSSDEGDDSEADSDDDDDDDDDESDEDEVTPKKAEPEKKRPAEAAAKTPTPSKKAKVSTPQKTDGKKGVHTATPHPAKQAGKTKEHPQKSAGQFQCKTCSKTFNSDNALKSHSAAKHSAK
ncbi:hypothetical protein MLD38_025271 [Melastoma candidum]|uniref:Uncharacterized protein n=1 Tax=Melastoma candidum TaxID=119954 RepID=A0ACB9NUK3_9MYRT|nr:hypothetical protein MLD38_025271 [Melastoma candidum]